MTTPTYDALTSRLTPVVTNTGMEAFLNFVLAGNQTLHLFTQGPDDPFSYDVELDQFVEADYLGYGHHVIVDTGISDEWSDAEAENGVATSLTSIFQFEKLPDTNSQTIVGYFVKDDDDNILFWNLFYSPVTLPQAGLSFNLELFATLQPYTCSISIEARITSTGGIELGGLSHWAIVGEDGIQDVVGGFELSGAHTSRIINYASAGAAGIAYSGSLVGGVYILDPQYYTSVGGFVLGANFGYRKVFPGYAGFLLGADADYWTGFLQQSTGGVLLGGEQESEVVDTGGGFTCTGDGNDFSVDRGNWSTNYGTAPTVSGGKLLCSITGGTCGAINTTSPPSGDIEFQGECDIISATVSASTQINFALRFGANNFGGRMYFTGSSPWQFSLTTFPGSAGTTGTLDADKVYFKVSYDPAGAGPMKIWISDGVTDWGPYSTNLGGGVSMTGTIFYVGAGAGESINVQADNFCMTDTRTI